MVSVLLTESGHKPEAVHDGELALEKIRQNPGFYDIVFVDHQMPKMTGLGLVGILHEAGFPGKIIIISGNLSREVKDAYKSLKVDMIIHKPFDLYEIEAAVSGFARKISQTH